MSRKKWSSLVLVAIAFLFLLIFSPCLSKLFHTVRITTARDQSIYNIKEIALAIHNYHDAIGHLPPAVVRDKEGRALYSWRVLILPHIEQYGLYSNFHLDEPWDSPHNLPLSKKPPRCYIPPWGENDPAITRYQVFIGPSTAFERPELTWADFPDGLRNTILVVEAGEPVIWSKPDDVIYDPSGPLPSLGAGYSKPIHFLCREVARRPGFVACFADGSARFIPTSTDEKIIRALITRNGGEKMDASWLD